MGLLLSVRQWGGAKCSLWHDCDGRGWRFVAAFLQLRNRREGFLVLFDDATQSEAREQRDSLKNAGFEYEEMTEREFSEFAKVCNDVLSNPLDSAAIEHLAWDMVSNPYAYVDPSLLDSDE